MSVTEQATTETTTTPTPETSAAPYTAKLTEGRIVHFVLDQGRCKGQHRPGIVTRVWDKTSGTVQLQVFTDDANDDLPGVMWRTSVHPDPAGSEPYSWHWPEPAT